MSRLNERKVIFLTTVNAFVIYKLQRMVRLRLKGILVHMLCWHNSKRSTSSYGNGHTVSLIFDRCIGGCKGAPGTRPLWVQILSFSCSFREEIGQIIGLRPHLGSCLSPPPPRVWEILDPPLRWVGWGQGQSLLYSYLGTRPITNLAF